MGPRPRGAPSWNRPPSPRRSKTRSARPATHVRPSKRSKTTPRQRRFGSAEGSRLSAGKVDAHHHRAVGFDVAEAAEVHPVREPADHARERAPERQHRLPHARDHEEQPDRDEKGRGRAGGAHPHQRRDRDEARRGRVAPGGQRLGLHVVQEQHPGAEHEKRDEEREEADAERDGGGGHEQEEGQEAHVAQVAQRAAQEQADEDQHKQEVHHAVQHGGGQVQQVERDGHRRHREQAHDQGWPHLAAPARALDPEADGDRRRDERGAERPQEPPEHQGQDAGGHQERGHRAQQEVGLRDGHRPVPARSTAIIRSALAARPGVLRFSTRARGRRGGRARPRRPARGARAR